VTWAGHEKQYIHTQFSFENLMTKLAFGRRDEKITRVFGEQVVVLCTGLNWFTIASNGGLL
jgi:hypothetical protein